MPSPAVFLFIQEGCGACHEFRPTFEHVAGPLRATMPVGVYDISKPDRRVQRFAESLGVRVTPTTVVMTSGGVLKRHEGALGVTALRQALQAAT